MRNKINFKPKRKKLRKLNKYKFGEASTKPRHIIYSHSKPKISLKQKYLNLLTKEI